MKGQESCQSRDMMSLNRTDADDGATGHKVVSILAGQPHSDNTFQPLPLNGEETFEQKYCVEQLNDLILIEGTDAHVTRSKFSKNKTSRIDQPEKTIGDAI
jgi:hypothetical protein